LKFPIFYFAHIFSAPFDALVVKASGLAAGKGVIVASDIAEACAAVDEILCEKKFGSAGDVVVIEEKLTGEEVSVSDYMIQKKNRSISNKDVFRRFWHLSMVIL